MVVELSKKDEKFRDLSLNGNIWKLIWKVSLPLAFYYTFQWLLGLFEMMMASHISALAVSATTYLSQLVNILNAIGSGLVAGCCVKISESYGAGKYDLVKKQLSTLIAMALILSGFIVALIPFTSTILKLLGTPESFIEIGSKYFIIKLVYCVLFILTTVYVGIERLRGKSKKLLILNLVTALVDFCLTWFFVYKLNCDVTMLAVAPVISTSILLIFGIFNLCFKNDAFSFSFKYVSFKRDITFPLLKISYPTMIERTFFQIGRTFMNVLASFYGELAVGALGLSNTINGIPYQTQTGFQDGGSAVISQNRGAKKIKRTEKIFNRIMIINLIIGFIAWILLNLFFNQISALFSTTAHGNDLEFQKMLINIFRWDSLGSCVPMGVSITCFAYLMGFGKTKQVLIINIFRIFVYRIPILFLLQKFTSLGPESTGIVMGISNSLTAIHIYIVVKLEMKKQCKMLENQENECE